MVERLGGGSRAQRVRAETADIDADGKRVLCQDPVDTIRSDRASAWALLLTDRNSGAGFSSPWPARSR